MKPYLPPLKSLQFFMVAGQLNSFKLAAQQLNVTQAAVSQQIKLLEEHLDLVLFERSNKQTRLTASGNKLLPFIEQGFGSLQAGVKAVSGDANPHILRISAIHSFTSLWLLPRLQNFQKLNPDIMIQIAPSNEVINFATGDIDLAIRMGGGGYKGLKEKKLANDELIFVASPELLNGADLMNPDAIFSLPWLEDTSSKSQPIFDDACKGFGIDRSRLLPIIRSNNSVTLIENAISGLGFTTVVKSLVADHLNQGTLVRLLGFSVQSPYCLYLVAPEQHFGWQKIKRFEQWFVPEINRSYEDLDKW